MRHWALRGRLIYKGNMALAAWKSQLVMSNPGAKMGLRRARRLDDLQQKALAGTFDAFLAKGS